MSFLEDKTRKLEQDLEHSVKELQQAKTTIQRLQERLVSKITTGHCYHQDQYDRRRVSGSCIRCGGSGHFHATCPQRNSPTTTIQLTPTPLATRVTLPTDPIVLKTTAVNTHKMVIPCDHTEPRQGGFNRR